jgi:hypothetical protein
MSEPAKGTHWSNLISILGVGGKKGPEPPAPVAPVASVAPTPSPIVSEHPAPESIDPLNIDWGKPSIKKRAVAPKVDAKPASPLKAPPSVAAERPKPAPRPVSNPKKKHWGGLAEQLGLAPSEPAVDEEPAWIEEAEKSGNVLSGDDAADECVSHPGGAACAPEECDVRSESCKLRESPASEFVDTRDTEYLDDVPASDEDLDALADLINEGASILEGPRREPSRDDDEDDFERPRGESREVREEGGDGPRRRRRRGRGRIRRDEAGPARAPSQSSPPVRDVRDEGPKDRYGGFDARPERRDDDSDEDLDRELKARDSDDDTDLAEEVDVRRPPREESSRDDEQGVRRRRRRRRRRGSEETAESDRGPRREPELSDRVRGGDPEYRRKEEPSDFDDDEDGDEPVAVHRNLPTWEDALSAIIGGNMENRARSPQQPSGGRRGGGGRDRDRGDRGDRGPRRDRGYDRGHERGSDRGPERGPERGSSDRGPERGPDRGPRRDDRGRDDRR